MGTESERREKDAQVKEIRNTRVRIQKKSEGA